MIHGVVKALIDALDPPELDGIRQFMSTNNRNLPREFDGKLLAKTRAVLGRDLEPSEKSAARRQFREYLESRDKKKTS